MPFFKLRVNVSFRYLFNTLCMGKLNLALYSENTAFDCPFTIYISIGSKSIGMLFTFSTARIYCLNLEMEINSELRFLLSETNEGKKLSEYHLTILNKRNICTVIDFLDAVNLHTHLALRPEQVKLIKRELLSKCVKSCKLSDLYKKSPINYSTGIEECVTHCQ